jgi:hypothetical protein
MDAKINGRPVRFIVDTGCGAPLTLFPKAAKKLRLKVTPPSPDTRILPGQTPFGWIEPQKVSFGTDSIESGLCVLELPAFMKWPQDGIIGWPALRDNVLSIDCIARTISPFTNATENLNDWHAYWLHTNSDRLVLELPGEGQCTPLIALDTGSCGGVSLSPERWRAWLGGCTNEVMTMNGYYTPNPGIVVTEEAWAQRILLGDLRLTGVPVMEANSSNVALDTSPKDKYVATLGLAALKRLDILVDGRRGIIWLRPKESPPTPYRHNRLGAAFAPKDLGSDDLIAHVANGSPAFEAGIRNGDILLKYGKHAIHWGKSIWDGNGQFEERAGTKIDLTLKRGDKVFKVTATLRNILPPDTAAGGVHEPFLETTRNQVNPGSSQ